MIKICFIIFLFLQSFILYSQKNVNLLSFVDEVTISLNQTRFSSESRAESNVGFSFGFNKIWLDTNKFNFGFGVYYDRVIRNRKQHLFDTYFFLNSNLSLDILSIPFFCRINVGEKTRFFIELGGYFDIGNKGAISGYTTFKRQYKTILSFNTRKVNFGTSGGLGLLLTTKKHVLILKGEFKYGFLDVMPNYEKGWQNQYFKFSLGLGF
ncbi:MAG: outer membrane beta-barrel protein [Flavobacteriales bacterium]